MALNDVDVDIRPSVLKPIHATWLVSMLNHHLSSEGRKSIAKGWKKAGISEVIDGSKELPPEDPFDFLKNKIKLRTLESRNLMPF